MTHKEAFELVDHQLLMQTDNAVRKAWQTLKTHCTQASAQQLKAEIAALVSKFDHSSIIDCNGDLVWLLKQLRQLSAV